MSFSVVGDRRLDFGCLLRLPEVLAFGSCTDRQFCSEAPNVAGVKWHNLSTVSLGNVGAIINVINTTGPQTPTNSTPATVVSYP